MTILKENRCCFVTKKLTIGLFFVAKLFVLRYVKVATVSINIGMLHCNTLFYYDFLILNLCLNNIYLQ